MEVPDRYEDLQLGDVVDFLESHPQPVYYAGGGKGYSGQPEPGDTQYLYFPSGREEDRYIIGCVDAGEDRMSAIAAQEKAVEPEEGGVRTPKYQYVREWRSLCRYGGDLRKCRDRGACRNIPRCRVWSCYEPG